MHDSASTEMSLLLKETGGLLNVATKPITRLEQCATSFCKRKSS